MRDTTPYIYRLFLSLIPTALTSGTHRCTLFKLGRFCFKFLVLVKAYGRDAAPLNSHSIIWSIGGEIVGDEPWSGGNFVSLPDDLRFEQDSHVVWPYIVTCRVSRPATQSSVIFVVSTSICIPFEGLKFCGRCERPFLNGKPATTPSVNFAGQWCLSLMICLLSQRSHGSFTRYQLASRSDGLGVTIAFRQCETLIP